MYKTLIFSSPKRENRFQIVPETGSEIGGGLVGLLWPRLGPSWGVLGPLWASLGASWGRLGASWGRLGAILSRSGGQSGCLEPSWRCLGAVLALSWRCLGRLKAQRDGPTPPTPTPKSLKNKRFFNFFDVSGRRQRQKKENILGHVGGILAQLRPS